MSMVVEEKELRKAWLKRKFGSWEYHEELLKLHDEYLAALHRHWARPEIQKKFPDDYQTMQRPVFLNFDKVQKPGMIPKSTWRAGKESGWANAISYNFNRGLGDIGGYPVECMGMDEIQIDRLNKLVGDILHHCTNITYLVETNYVNRKGTDDIILSEEVTGPIAWPPNWREEIAQDLGINPIAPSATRCEAGKPCPHAGFWWTPAKQSSRRYFQQGEIMPDFSGSGYGVTIWMWDANQ